MERSGYAGEGRRTRGQRKRRDRGILGKNEEKGIQSKNGSLGEGTIAEKGVQIRQ